MPAHRSTVKPRAASARSRAFELVTFGASAGGIEVLHGLLAALPKDFAPAVMIVVHLPPDPPSYLVQSFSHRCALPVIEPDAHEQILGGRVYVAPPGYHLMVESDRTVALSTEAAVRFSRPSIDVMFESAAWVYRERLLAILLSGANEDGVRGLATVRSLGGHTWAQDPDTASSPEMPRAAIERGVVDDVLTPSSIAQSLVGLPASIDQPA
ncbi:chemotaxis protein CheB [Paraburkholderia sp. DHOC27]|uniref:chemotaxis protein CheB n=1 Tax=Paraburkholderia sp. DHOC27 TaxID=2303330 RepID=UPI000E3B609A|nr:chemotaxis protein CheB [Paraburkholderia sp. DHOC27]RFU44586.1 chemotaxis protein CheB [Paraburkholderia sp. DHOC27]